MSYQEIRQAMRERVHRELYGDDHTQGLLRVIAGLGSPGILKDYESYRAACARVQAMELSLQFLDECIHDLTNPEPEKKPDA